MRRSSRWQVRVLLVFFACAGEYAQAQDGDRFRSKLLPVVAPATIFIEEAQANRAYPLGQTVVLTRRRSKASADIHSHTLQARVFRLNALGQVVPNPWHTIGDCDIYLTNVIGIPSAYNQADNALPLGQFDDDAWLQPNIETGRMEPGRYLVVFEQSADSQSVFRLNHKDHGREQYFEQGYLLVLEPPPTRTYSPSDVRAIYDRLEKFRGILDAEVKRNDPTRVCYLFRAVTPVLNDADGITLALAPCKDENELRIPSVD